MPYLVTPTDLASITDVELAFSTERLLPRIEDIPEDFLKGNRYTKLASAIFYGTALPDFEMEFKPGFEPNGLNRAVRAHLASFGPKHDHKIAGVGFLIAQTAVLV